MDKDTLRAGFSTALIDGLAVKIEIKDGYLNVTNIGVDETTYYQVLLLLAAAANSISKTLDEQIEQDKFASNTIKH